MREKRRVEVEWRGEEKGKRGEEESRDEGMDDERRERKQDKERRG